MNVQYIGWMNGWMEGWMDGWMGFLNCPEAVSTAHLVKSNAKNGLQMLFDPDLVSIQTPI